jgi:hypothetical protein
MSSLKEKPPCRICLIIHFYKWSEETKNRFNAFVKANVKGSFTKFARRFIYDNFNLPDDDLMSCSLFLFKRHIEECLPLDLVASNIVEMLPKEQDRENKKPLVTKAEVNSLLRDFRKLNFEDKTNTLIENWKEIVALLMFHTKKSIESKMSENSKYILDSQDVVISKLIVDTFKVINQEKFNRNENPEQISYKGKDINYFKNILEDESC